MKTFYEQEWKRNSSLISQWLAISLRFSQLKKGHTYSLKSSQVEQMCSLKRGFFSLPVERTLTLPHTEGQQPRGPVRRIAAHLTGSSSRRSSLSSRSKDKLWTPVKHHRVHWIALPLLASCSLTPLNACIGSRKQIVLSQTLGFFSADSQQIKGKPISPGYLPNSSFGTFIRGQKKFKCPSQC